MVKKKKKKGEKEGHEAGSCVYLDFIFSHCIEAIGFHCGCQYNDQYGSWKCRLALTIQMSYHGEIRALSTLS